MNSSQWSLIVREHTPLVWKTVYRLVAHQADAADCFQETFISAWELAQREAVRNWGGLLPRLATARALDRLRRRRRQAKDVAPVSELGEIAATGNGPLAQAQSEELAAQLRRALADLPAKQSEAYCLRHLNGFSYEQIADELEMSVSAVGVTLHRATQRLREVLTPILNDERSPR